MEEFLKENDNEVAVQMKVEEVVEEVEMDHDLGLERGKKEKDNELKDKIKIIHTPNDSNKAKEDQTPQVGIEDHTKSLLGFQQEIIKDEYKIVSNQKEKMNKILPVSENLSKDEYKIEEVSNGKKKRKRKSTKNEKEEEPDDLESIPTKEKKKNKQKKEDVDDDLSEKKLSELKDILSELGLSKTGTKEELLERIRIGVLTFIPPDEEKSVAYDFDPTTPRKKKYFIEKAKSAKGKCVRCLCTIDQGLLRVGFDSWDTIERHALKRNYHLECFAKYPPNELNNFGDIIFDSKDKNTFEEQKAKLESEFSKYSPHNQES